MFAIDIIGIGGNLIGTGWYARRQAHSLPTARLDRALRRRVVRFAGISSISVFVSFVVYQRTEVLFLGHYSTNTEIALYWIPFTVVSGLTLLTWAAGAAFGPAVATLWERNRSIASDPGSRGRYGWRCSPTSWSRRH